MDFSLPSSRFHARSLIQAFVFSLIPVLLWAQESPPYRNPSLPVDQRVDDLLGRMSPEEKFWQLFMVPGEVHPNEYVLAHGIFGLQVRSQGKRDPGDQIIQTGQLSSERVYLQKINAVQAFFTQKTRLGIPVIPFEEALHGLLAEGATVFPQAIALAASWDTVLMGRVAGAIATETARRGIRQVLSPVVNIATDVRWGRVEETYGEDPLLASAMGVAFVRQFEKRGIITTPKHFVANHGDGGRDSYPSSLDERSLREYYLPPFLACFREGHARSVMTSYNSWDGSPCTANSRLLDHLLKEEGGFEGFVISDAAAVGGANVLHMTASDYPEASANAMNRGLDVIFQTDPMHYTLFQPPFLDGRIAQTRIDAAVKRVLKIKFELGLFENPFVSPTDQDLSDQRQAHRDLCREAGRQGIVLLKNENRTLPISTAIRSIAVIGTDAAEGRLGGYSGQPDSLSTILEGIKEMAPPQTQIWYAPGCGRQSSAFQVVPDSILFHTTQKGIGNGLQAEYFNNPDLIGKPDLVRNDRAIQFRWTLYSPDPVIQNGFYSVRWTGFLRSPLSGTFPIGLEGNDGFRLYLDGQLLIDHWDNQTYAAEYHDFSFEKGKEYSLKVELREPVGGASIRLVWRVVAENEADQLIQAAVDIARNSDLAVVVAGIEEGEGLDRADLSLPGRQEDLIQALSQTGKPLVVVLTGGSAITMNKWLTKAEAVLMAWYPGEQGGRAVADVLFGHHNPGGRLPITFPVTEGQLPLNYNHKPTGRNDDYADCTGLPLFPFGYGLSYSDFSYTSLTLNKARIPKGGTATLRFQLKNLGPMDGDEVVQLYIRDLVSTLARPVMELKGFQRIHLKNGEDREVTFQIGHEQLSFPDEAFQNTVEPGDYLLMVGSSSRDIRLRTVLRVE